MFSTLRQKQVLHPAKKLIANARPRLIDWRDGGHPAIIEFTDGQRSPGSCIRCHNPMCMEYSASELEISAFEEFPADWNNQVCPTAAITWPQNSDTPTIDQSMCICCGICVNRCPIRAIYLDHTSAHVNDQPNQHFFVSNKGADEQTTFETTRLFDGVVESGIYLRESDDVFLHFRQKFEEVVEEQTAQFPNHLARNLLTTVGISAAMRRRGDAYIRMDLVLGPPGVVRGTAEVEMGSEILDAPRDILDNIAVLVGRYNVPKDNFLPLIVSLSLPNQRSEYWQFIKDVKTVLNIWINSITVGALVVLVWNRVKIGIKSGDELYIDVDHPSLRPNIEKILGRRLQITGDGYPGFLESGK